MPHALLIHEAPGTGGDWLAAWTAALVLCGRGKSAPCGECAACRRVAALQHPDVNWVRPQEESRQIRIEQVRELSAELALTSHGGGYKVGVIAPADALNRFAANALLKTLEEPPSRTLLILVATEPSRLPPTVLSRCQRLQIRAPERADSVAWLNAVRGEADWDAALDSLGEAPLQVAQGDPAELAAVGAARITLRPVHAAPVPGEPAPGLGVDVLAVPEVEQLALERQLGLGIGPRVADLALEHDRHRHLRTSPPRLVPARQLVARDAPPRLSIVKPPDRGLA